MITINIDCPFSIGEWVYVMKKEYDTAEVECPFCHGNSKYNTGIKITTDYDLKTFPWVIECKTCNGTGKVSTTEGFHYTYIKAKIINIYCIYESIDWKRHRYTIEYEDGSRFVTYGQNIITESEYLSNENAL